MSGSSQGLLLNSNFWEKKAGGKGEGKNLFGCELMVCGLSASLKSLCLVLCTPVAAALQDG